MLADKLAVSENVDSSSDTCNFSSSLLIFCKSATAKPVLSCSAWPSPEHRLRMVSRRWRSYGSDRKRRKKNGLTKCIHSYTSYKSTRQLEGISLEIFLTFEMHTDLPAAVLNMSAWDFSPNNKHFTLIAHGRYKEEHYFYSFKHLQEGPIFDSNV